ncbi:MAG TPA: bifunctional phosphoribosyl-AMP cyclohydrolase/phosphoribosyl-ATP diphosphatase HisIE [Limnochordia bacterium]
MVEGFDIDALRFDEHGLLPAVVQDASSGEVLMVAYMNREAVERTLASGYTWFWSRSRQRLWQKGETSGHVQRVIDLGPDCDGDALLVRVEQVGPGACHEGYRSCFHRQSGASRPPRTFAPETVYKTDQRGEGNENEPSRIVRAVYETILSRKAHPTAESYTAYLFREGIDKILKKVGEEATEVVIAAKNPPTRPLVSEAADLVYHLLVLLAERGVAPEEVFAELAARRR